jgi:RHS repeat-associated protein
VSPDRDTTNLTYTSAGLPLTRTDARGVTANFTFDALNRPTTITYTGVPAVNGLIGLWLNSLGSSILSDNVSFSYDQGMGCTLAVGRLCARHDQSGVESFSYDIHGNVIQQMDTELEFNYTTQYSYDNANQLTQMTYPDGRVVNYSRDALERVSGIQALVNRVTSPIASALQYRADSTLAGMTFGNGIVETRGYDPVGRLVGQLVGAVDARAYSYNDVGDMTGKQTSAESDQFLYDSLDRLIGEGRTQGTTTHSNGFGYDPNNNRLTETRDGVLSSLSYTPNTNRLIQLGSAALTLDSAGNTTADTGGTRKFYYTAANHLQWISQNGLPSAGYLYNGLGQRTGKLTAQGISLYHYDIYGRLITETTIGSQPSRDYVWSGSTPIAQIDHWVPIGTMLQEAHCSIGADGKIDWISYLHTDGLGTPRTATDVSQNVVWRDDGETFGETAPTQTVPSGAYPVIVNLRNPGQYFDQETGLFYNVARYYNPQSGRYITSDLIGLGGGLNTYSYIGQNPLGGIDPLGLLTGSIGYCGSSILGFGGVVCGGYYVSYSNGILNYGPFVSGGGGVGVNASFGVDVGLYTGGLETFTGPTISVSGAGGVLADIGAGATFNTSGNLIGGTLSIGLSATPISGSITLSNTSVLSTGNQNNSTLPGSGINPPRQGPICPL